MLAYQWQAQRGIPVVFLHGLLGSTEDWQAVFQALQFFPAIRPLAIDLPGHGQSTHITCASFAQLRQQLSQTLRAAIRSQPFYLVGYSLGGRIALDYLCNAEDSALQGVILEGANVGLNDEKERLTRLANDEKWAARFASEKLEKVLNDWYQQPVFANLSPRQRLEFIQKRQKNNGRTIAQMLLATSLAKQPRLLPPPQSHYCFFIGEQDLKFRQIAEYHQLRHQLISQAGHNTHQANPDEFVEKLVLFLQKKTA